MNKESRSIERECRRVNRRIWWENHPSLQTFLISLWVIVWIVALAAACYLSYKH